MEALPWSGAILLPRLLIYIWKSRTDLQLLFPKSEPEAASDLLCWFRAAARREYPGAIDLSDNWVQITEEPSQQHPWNDQTAVPRIAVMLWVIWPEIRNLFDRANPIARKRLSLWFYEAGHRFLPSEGQAARTTAPKRKQISGNSGDLCLGVNLVGFANAEFGLGEDVRMASRALDLAEIPHVIISAATPQGVRGADHSRDQKISEHLTFPISVFCMSAFDTAQLYLEKGPWLFGGRFNIGYWPWELPSFPKAWTAVTQLVSEVWAGSHFQFSSYKATCLLPIRLMPLSVDVQASSEVRGRPRVFTFIYPFDPRSFIARKNPIAAVSAFRRAFPRSDRSVCLILRANGNPDEAKGWPKVLRAICGDKRIRVVGGTLDRKDALALLQGSQCMISPHRSEGFGRNIGEAILLGVPVIATSFSGPSDFLVGNERLKSRQRLLKTGEYPFSENQHWAEPSVAGLAQLMRHRRANPLSRFAAKRRCERYQSTYSPEIASVRLKDALSEIFASLAQATPEQSSNKRSRRTKHTNE